MFIDLHLRNIEKLFKPNLAVDQELKYMTKYDFFYDTLLNTFEIKMLPDSCDQMSR